VAKYKSFVVLATPLHPSTLPALTTHKSLLPRIWSKRWSKRRDL